MALAIQNCAVTQLHELIIDGIFEEKAPGKRSEADIAVEEFLNLTRSRYGFGPVASLFKAYLAVAASN
jgi:hypothetical protein